MNEKRECFLGAVDFSPIVKGLRTGFHNRQSMSVRIEIDLGRMSEAAAHSLVERLIPIYLMNGRENVATTLIYFVNGQLAFCYQEVWDCGIELHPIEVFDLANFPHIGRLTPDYEVVLELVARY